MGKIGVTFRAGAVISSGCSSSFGRYEKCLRKFRLN